MCFPAIRRTALDIRAANDAINAQRPDTMRKSGTRYAADYLRSKGVSCNLARYILAVRPKCYTFVRKVDKHLVGPVFLQTSV